MQIEDKSFALTTWKATDLTKVLSLSKKNSYSVLKKAIKDLANKSVFIYRPELEKEHDIPWSAIAECQLPTPKGSGLAPIRSCERVKPSDL